MSKPIESYGVIGDLGTTALIGKDGSIDFLCWPRFDSPSVFAALLDDARGGCFQITPPLAGATQQQLYVPDTNVLLTRFLSEAGESEITDFMAMGERPRVIRTVRAVRGHVEHSMRCAPRFDYARAAHSLAIEGQQATFTSDGLTLRLSASVPLRASEQLDAESTFTLAPGELATFVLDAGEGDALSPADIEASLQLTVAYWQDWSRRSTYKGRWREMVQRSALVLKLLTSKDCGSIIAAPTFGLSSRI